MFYVYMAFSNMMFLISYLQLSVSLVSFHISLQVLLPLRPNKYD